MLRSQGRHQQAIGRQQLLRSAANGAGRTVSLYCTGTRWLLAATGTSNVGGGSDSLPVVTQPARETIGLAMEQSCFGLALSTR